MRLSLKGEGMKKVGERGGRKRSYVDEIFIYEVLRKLDLKT